MDKPSTQYIFGYHHHTTDKASGHNECVIAISIFELAFHVHEAQETAIIPQCSMLDQSTHIHTSF